MNDRDLFAELAPLEPAQRAALLERVCAHDPQQRTRMEALLAGLEREPEFLKTPLVSPPTLVLELSAGDRIGAYTLRQKLGEGGCGIVWMAEQEQPIRRRVALKVVKLGMDTREVIARFEAERQALALMDHPNIAKVFDAGATELGRPYFVMELVRGVPITKYCDELAISTRDRLDLFIQVCHAVQHAHQKGVIHRDLKPSNILVSLTDAGAVPKVIDFGIAKATQGRLADETIFTSFEQFIGTPAYISPEQAELSGLDVDTRSDIYSLGVLLYELLTGRTPFDPRELAQAGLDEMRRRIRETEPPRPSTRLGTLQAELLGTIARHRHTAPPDLIQQVRGDLDWIVMRCLEKDRTRRYPSASALGEDVRRHLHDEPVEARPPSRLYRLGKLVRRNRLVFALVGATAATLVISALAASREAVRASRAEQIALQAGAEQTRLRQVAEELQAAEARARARAEASELTTRRAAYAADMRTLQQELNHSNYSYARSLLDWHRPRQPDEPDFRGWEWRYGWQQIADDSVGTLSSDAAISALAVSADGEWLAGVRLTPTLTHDVVVWNLRTRERRALPTTVFSRAIPLPTKLIAFAPTTPRLAVAARTERDGKQQTVLELWEAATGQPIRQWPLPAECRAIHFAPDGETLLTWIPQPAEKKHQLIVWRVADGTKVRTEELPFTNWLAVDPQWRRAVTCGLKKMQAFDVSSREDLWDDAGIYANALAFSPDGEVFASAAFQDHGTIRLRDAASGRWLGALEGHRGPVTSLTFSPDGATLVSSSQDQTIRVWNTKTRTQERALVGSNGDVRCVALLRQGRTLVSASNEEVRLWDPDQSSRRTERVEIDARIVHWQFGTDSASLVTVNRQGDVIRRYGERWASEDYRVNIGEVRDDPDVQPHIQLSAQPPLVAASKDKGVVAVWDWERRLQVGKIHTGAYQVLIAGFIDHGRRLVLSCQAAPDSDSMYSEWEIASGHRVRDWPREFGRSVAISADGRSAVMFGETDCSLLDVASGTVQSGRFPHGRRVFVGTRSSISPDGRILVVPGMTNVGVFELPAIRPVTTLTGYMANTLSTAFSPDGRRLAVSSGFSDSLVLYDSASWERVLMLDTPELRVSQVRISPDGNAIGVMPLKRGVVYLWRAPSWAEIEASENSHPAQRTRSD